MASASLLLVPVVPTQPHLSRRPSRRRLACAAARRRWDSNAAAARSRSFGFGFRRDGDETGGKEAQGFFRSSREKRRDGEASGGILDDAIDAFLILKVNPWKLRRGKSRLNGSSLFLRRDLSVKAINCNDMDHSLNHNFLINPFLSRSRTLSVKLGSVFMHARHVLIKSKRNCGLVKKTNYSEEIRQNVYVPVVRVAVGVMLALSLSAAITKSPSSALTEENLLFLEAWRTIDRAYVDKSFNGQSWFRYRENALRSEPMNTREETYVAIKKMLATLDDPFTRFLEPGKLRSLRSGTQNTLTGVGLSIGYPTKSNESSPGLIVISASPGGPASRAGVVSGDMILAIDNLSTEDMGIYDAAESLQGPEGSSVRLTIRSGLEVKNLSLVREKVLLNPVKSRLCELPSSQKDSRRIGYIKLTSFNQNASGAVKEAIDALQADGVSAFVLDLRDNSGGLFPEGIEIAKIWLDKGVIVYICDNMGVRDIYDTDGTSAVAPSEPLAVLVNKGTASASEILAGALKDNKRAMLFGEPTFGKGKIQSVFQLSDGSGLAVTVARYQTPSHTDIDKVGVMPDHPLPKLFPKDVDGFCGCLEDTASACYFNKVELFSR